MARHLIAVDLQNSLYQAGLITLLSRIPWISLTNSNDPDLKILFTDQYRLPQIDTKVVFVTDCTKHISPSLINRQAGIICTAEINSQTLNSCVTGLLNHSKFVSPTIQALQLKIHFKCSIGEERLAIVQSIIANPSGTLDEYANMTNASKSTISRRIRELHDIFHSNSKAELVVRFYESGLATV